MTSTLEREITAAVDLATADGRRLNPAALGWSRVPLHRANLQGSWGRNKRWDYWAILAGNLVISTTYADVDYLGLADIWWADLETGRTGGAAMVVPGARGIDLPDLPGTQVLRARKRSFDLAISDDPDGTSHIAASWKEGDGTAASLAAAIALPDGHESLNVVIPWSERRFQFTSKHQARPAVGSFSLGHYTHQLEDAPRGAWGVLDVGRGRWPYRSVWNWGGGAGRVGSDGPVIGLQLGGKWTAGTGFTENGLIVDGRLSKLGEELEWRYDWEDPMRPWSVRDPGGRLELLLEPAFDRHARTAAVILSTETHQVFGTWSGEVVADDGRRLAFEGIQGFAEESRSRW
jgi:hypothetical protein